MESTGRSQVSEQEIPSGAGSRLILARGFLPADSSRFYAVILLIEPFLVSRARELISAEYRSKPRVFFGLAFNCNLKTIAIFSTNMYDPIVHMNLGTYNPCDMLLDGGVPKNTDF
jgi:hypothetical protein